MKQLTIVELHKVMSGRLKSDLVAIVNVVPEKFRIEAYYNFNTNQYFRLIGKSDPYIFHSTQQRWVSCAAVPDGVAYIPDMVKLLNDMEHPIHIGEEKAIYLVKVLGDVGEQGFAEKELLLLVKNKKELVEKIADRFNNLGIYESSFEDLDGFESVLNKPVSQFELTTRYQDVTLQIKVLDKTIIP